MQKNSLKPPQSKMEQTRLKQMQNDQRLQGSNMQRLSNTTSQLGTLNAQRQQTTASTAHQRQQTPVQSPQLQKQSTLTQKSQYEQSSLTSASQNIQSVDVESSDSSAVLEQTNQQNFSSQTDSENSSSESIAYLQQVIHNPKKAKVWHQVQGNTAKMLVTFPSGEQRLIEFDIPSKDCTVQNLLDQANVRLRPSTTVSLVSDPTLGINYIVDVKSSTITAPHDTPENDSSQENSAVSFDYSPSSPDGNSNPI